MQRILELKICNIGPIEGERIVGFDPNSLLTSLTGHNGCGKSTMLKAIASLQTGVLMATKEDILNVGSKSGYMEATMLGADGKSKYIHHIGFGRGETTWLETPESKLTKAAEIKDYIANYHSVSPRTLLKTNFVRQGDLSAIMSDLKSDRAKVISELSGIDNAEVVWKNIGEYIGKFRLDDSSPGRLERAKTELSLAYEEKNRAAVALAACTKVDDAAELELHKVLNQYDKFLGATKDLTNLGNFDYRALEKLTGQYSQLGQQIKDLSSQQSKVNVAKLKEISNSYIRAQALVEQEPKYKELDAKLRVWRGANMERPVDDLPDLTPLQETQATLASIINEANKHLATLGSGNCYACNQRLPNADKHIHENRVKLAQAEENLAKLKTQLADLTAKKTAILEKQRKFDTTLAQHDAKRKETDEFFAKVKSLAAPSKAEFEQAAVVLAEHEERTTQLAELNRQLNACSAQVTVGNNNRDQYEKRKAELKKIIDSSPSKQAVEDAREKLNKISTLRKIYNEYSAALKVAEYAAETKEAEFDEATKAFAEFEKNQKLVFKLQQMRDLVHRDSLPAKVAAQFLTKTALRAQEYLKPFEADFVLEADASEMSFIAEYADGKRLRVDQLSGGWTTAVALALRCATSDLISKHNKTLILDECIVFLDVDNMARIPMVLDKIKAVNKQVGRQMLMVTHEPNLLAVADHVINLDE